MIDIEEAQSLAGDDGAMTIDGFDHCIVGVATRCGQPTLIVYDFDLIMDSLCNEGMSYEEAMEYYQFNIAGAWVGDGTPLVMERIQY